MPRFRVFDFTTADLAIKSLSLTYFKYKLLKGTIMQKLTQDQLNEMLNSGCKDFSNMDLSGLNLTRADLRVADLTDANLTRSDLTDADLYLAQLTDANLTRADLTGADLTGADLTGADLTKAFINEKWKEYIEKCDLNT